VSQKCFPLAAMAKAGSYSVLNLNLAPGSPSYLGLREQAKPLSLIALQA
jgi:hypothetical protein